MKKTIQLCMISLLTFFLAFIIAAPSTSAQDANQANDQAGDQTSVQAGDQTSVQAGDQTGDQTGVKTSDQAYDKTSDQTGERFYMTKFCITCHGQKGVAVAPNYPNLAKQNEQYLANQVKDIINKKRANKLTLLMTENPVIISINEEEIAAVAAHLTNIKVTP